MDKMELNLSQLSSDPMIVVVAEEAKDGSVELLFETPRPVLFCGDQYAWHSLCVVRKSVTAGTKNEAVTIATQWSRMFVEFCEREATSGDGPIID